MIVPRINTSRSLLRLLPKIVPPALRARNDNVWIDFRRSSERPRKIGLGPHRSASPMRIPWLAPPSGCRLKEFLNRLLPEFGKPSSEMATRIFAGRNKEQTGVLHALEF